MAPASNAWSTFERPRGPESIRSTARTRWPSGWRPTGSSTCGAGISEDGASRIRIRRPHGLGAVRPGRLVAHRIEQGARHRVHVRRDPVVALPPADAGRRPGGPGMHGGAPDGAGPERAAPHAPHGEDRGRPGALRRGRTRAVTASDLTRDRFG